MRHFTSNGTDQCQNGLSNLLTLYQEQPGSTRTAVAYTQPAFSATKRANHAPICFDQQSKFLKATCHAEIRKIEIPRSMVLEVLDWRSRRASQHPAVQSPVHIPEKRPTNLARSPLLVGPLRKKTDRGQRSAFPSETSRFAPLILAHRDSALPWLVNDRAALEPRRIWCVLTR